MQKAGDNDHKNQRLQNDFDTRDGHSEFQLRQYRGIVIDHSQRKKNYGRGA